MVLLIISILLLFLYAVLIFFYTIYWKKAGIYHASAVRPNFISIIVAARNEEENITPLLNALQNQSYPGEFFEVIVVDDFSTDQTAALVQQHPLSNLKLIRPEGQSEQSSKKKAIHTGILHASGSLIVTTDADCLPGENWLEVVNSFYSEKDPSFIAAPVKFEYNRSLLQRFQAIDFLTLQGITAAGVTSGFHAMCNGANLAYKKKSFLSVNGFDGIDKVATGDDMLLMYKIWRSEPGKVHYLKSQEAIMSTQPMQSWKKFFMQRRRWASKTLVYDDKMVIAVLFLVYLVNCFFIVLVIAALLNSAYLWLLPGYLIIKSLIEFPFIYLVTRFYKEEKLRGYFFLFQPLHIMYTVLAGTLSQFGKYEWKGRKTK